MRIISDFGHFNVGFHVTRLLNVNFNTKNAIILKIGRLCNLLLPILGVLSPTVVIFRNRMATFCTSRTISASSLIHAKSPLYSGIHDPDMVWLISLNLSSAVLSCESHGCGGKLQKRYSTFQFSINRCKRFAILFYAPTCKAITSNLCKCHSRSLFKPPPMTLVC